MTARLIVFDQNGTKNTHRLTIHHKTANTTELKLVMDTSTEFFESWLFYFLRDHGAYIETTDPAAVASALNVPHTEKGIVRLILTS